MNVRLNTHMIDVILRFTSSYLTIWFGLFLTLSMYDKQFTVTKNSFNGKVVWILTQIYYNTYVYVTNYSDI